VNVKSNASVRIVQQPLYLGKNYKVFPEKTSFRSVFAFEIIIRCLPVSLPGPTEDQSPPAPRTSKTITKVWGTPLPTATKLKKQERNKKKQWILVTQPKTSQKVR